MTKKYSFGIDIDGTVTTPDFLLPYINEAYQTNITLDDVKTYDLTEALAVDKADFFKWFKSEELNMYKNPPIQLNAKRILTNWYPNVSLNYITAREENSRAVTDHWFKANHLPYDTIDIVGATDKVIAGRRHGVQLFMEDKHDNAVRIHEELDIPVLLFDAPYNREAIPNGVVRIKSWLEAENWVKKEFGV
ncbi:hypothetical protein [Rummeliibacillus sp. TYF005]|uniref:hypothetical protein n=1 Tax=Rummeliibacillus sp. TYF005 TaxID=2058214 RepID=UPI000F537BA0|nr:hypothetical protein [Rummeliibacillus sp. TYF005]RPJ95376.1 hypothetical protein CW357_10895 [Rummeliibacillus sp. TYF005]